VDYKPKRVGRPKKVGVDSKGKRRGKRKKYPGPGSPLRTTQHKVLNLEVLTHRMLKELSGYYQTSMRNIVHKLIEAAFKKTLVEIEQKEKEENETRARYIQEVQQRKVEREKRVAQNSTKP
jgi:hypothetical protein